MPDKDHIKCALKDYHRYESGMNTAWMCVSCLSSALPRDPSFISLNDSINSSYTTEGTDDDLQQDYNNESIFSHRQANPGLLLMAHSNINSIQNKSDELRLINDKLKTGILVITKTKIDSSYRDSQFKIENYRLHRQDRVMGGPEILAFISTRLPSWKLKIPNSLRP